MIMSNPAIVISVLALLFTVFSFWWMNWRKGTLHVGIPRTYAAFAQKDGKMVLEFPLIFFNSGPIPVFVHNLRVVFQDEKPQRPLTFIATVNKLGKDEGRSFATQFPVRGREAILLICEFHRTPGGIELHEGSYPLELQAILGNGSKWKRICRFPLNVSNRSAQLINKQFIVHDNVLD